jgi:hypothetical protein
MIGRLHFARDVALLVAGVEPGDPSGTGFGREDIRPRRFDIATERRHQP